MLADAANLLNPINSLLRENIPLRPSPLESSTGEFYLGLSLKQTRGRFSKVKYSGKANIRYISGRRTTAPLWEVQTRVILLVLPLSAKAT